MPESEHTRRALVLSGGGIAGIAWHAGVLAGLSAGGVDLAQFDLVVGTSAGAIVGAHIAANRPIEHLYQQQLGPHASSGARRWLGEARLALQTAEMNTLYFRFPEVERLWSHVEEMTPAWAARFGTMGVYALTPPESLWVRTIQRRIRIREWPARHLAICAVDAATGQRRVFHAESAVPLARAVAASAALPKVFPPVTIRGQRYIDGGFSSVANADVAAGSETILVLVAEELGVEGLPGLRRRALDAHVADLRAGGSQVRLIVTNEPSRAAMRPSHHDPRTRAPASLAGHAQGWACAPEVRAFLEMSHPSAPPAIAAGYGPA